MSFFTLFIYVSVSMSVYFHLNVLFVYDFFNDFFCVGMWPKFQLPIVVAEFQFMCMRENCYRRWYDDSIHSNILFVYKKYMRVCVLQVHNPWFNLGVSFSCSCFSCCLAATVLCLLVVAFFLFWFERGVLGKAWELYGVFIP